MLLAVIKYSTRDLICDASHQTQRVISRVELKQQCSDVCQVSRWCFCSLRWQFAPENSLL